MRGISFIFETQESEKGPMASKHSFNFFHKKLGPGALSIAFILGGASVTLYDDLKPLPPVIQDTHGIHIQACFTPGQRCQDLILGQIHQATRSISVMAYYLTAQPIIQALVEAHKRGVHVQVIIDKSQVSQTSAIRPLLQASIPLFNDRKVAIAHNKVMIIDEKIIISGSYNFTQAAETRNAENLLIITSPELVTLYQANWDNRQRSSEPILHLPPSDRDNKQ